MFPSCRRGDKDCTITKDDFQGTESGFPRNLQRLLLASEEAKVT